LHPPHRSEIFVRGIFLKHSYKGITSVLFLLFPKRLTSVRPRYALQFFIHFKYFTMKVVSYLRVSTKSQGADGLSIEAQRAQILAAYPTAQIIEFLEVETGKKNDRKILNAAMLKAKELGCTLVVAKLDRLSRNAAFLMNLQASKVDFRALNIPELNTLTLGIYAVMAQHERETISQRTKAALDARKAKGLTKSAEALEAATERLLKVQKSGVEAIKQKALDNENNKKAKGYAKLLRTNGYTLRKIVETLNVEGFKTSRGCYFTATAVVRLLAS
jgi:DNA invertase Pin-like site-specific DNA recombinase